MEDESDFTDQFIPKFVNVEPEIIKGLTQFELFFCVGFGFVFGFVFALIIGILTGLIAGMLCLVFGGVGSGLYVARRIKATKDGKPRGYMSFALRKFFIKLIGKAANPEGFYLFDENLTVGRSEIQRFIMINRGVQGDE